MCGRSQGERENFLLSDLSPSYRVLGLDATSLQVLMALYHWPLLILVHKWLRRSKHVTPTMVPRPFPSIPAPCN